MIAFDQIPACLKSLPAWVLWRVEPRSPGEDPTKIPYQPNGVSKAKANDPRTWGDFDTVAERFLVGGFDGIGFEFSRADDFCGIDLDGCRDTKTGLVYDWAKEVILRIGSYAEVSPSGTGVKIWCVAKSPFETGRKREVADAPRVNEKTPAIEIYDNVRFFAVTGWRLSGMPDPIVADIEWLKDKFFPQLAPPPRPALPFSSEPAIQERARKYLATIPPAISGSGGHNVTFRAACRMVLGFGLSADAACSLLAEWNQGCVPPWSERELWHKVHDAERQAGERNYLRNTKPEQWATMKLPEHVPPPPKAEPRITTLQDAARAYYDRVLTGQEQIYDLGIGEIDYAIGGGVEPGEMVVLCARPSHGKSAVALQIIHNFTGIGMPCAMVSEEMSAFALGKRSLQFLSDVPQEHWKTQQENVNRNLDEYAKERAECLIIESCGSAESAVEQIELAVKERGVKVAVVDYMQLLKSPGKGRYEQVTNTSIALRQLANRTKIVLIVLAQLSRAIEGRDSFVPVMSDLKETGQIEQDADVIIGMVWPWKIDNKQKPEEYQFFVMKNRNRPINQMDVVAKFNPQRQMITNPKRFDDFDQWNADSQASRKDFA